MCGQSLMKKEICKKSSMRKILNQKGNMKKIYMRKILNQKENMKKKKKQIWGKF